MPAKPPSPHAPELPDFANLGVVLRIVAIAEAVLVVLAFATGGTLGGVASAFVALSALAQPVLLTALFLLAILQEPIHRLSYGAAVTIIILGTAVLALSASLVAGTLYPDLRHDPLGFALAGAMIAGLGIGYFHLRNRALAPALTEARLTALQARIRPHFLFNTLNTVLALIRSDPARAETALQDLSDLFRVAMSDTRNLTRLDAELALARQYVALESLRLGPRLAVAWHTENAPPDARVPPLLLQPLIENAVYHGIEPLDTGGEIRIDIYLSRGQVHIVIRNPCAPTTGDRSAGNRIALANIRERLALHFDLEATLETRRAEGFHEVRIALPYRKAVA